MKHILLEFLLIVIGGIGSMFFYGVRSVVGKWLVTKTYNLMKRYWLKTEGQWALYIHHRNQAMKTKK